MSDDFRGAEITNTAPLKFLCCQLPSVDNMLMTAGEIN